MQRIPTASTINPAFLAQVGTALQFVELHYYSELHAIGYITASPSRHTMLAALRKLLGSTSPDDRATEPRPASSGQKADVRLAACALLVELAKVDGEFSALEHQRILEILQRHFGVSADGAEALVAAALVESRKSVDDFTFTRQVLRDYDLGQRMLLAELMWQVVLADGTIDSNESYLMRKLANLLQLDPAFLSEARRKTERSLE